MNELRKYLDIVNENEVELTTHQIESLADDAFNEAIAHIQKRLGVESGDLASHHFSDDDVRRAITNGLEEYIQAEIDFNR